MTGAPRPTLVNAGCDLLAAEHDRVTAKISAARTARVFFNSLIFDIPNPRATL